MMAAGARGLLLMGKGLCNGYLGLSLAMMTMGRMRRGIISSLGGFVTPVII